MLPLKVVGAAGNTIALATFEGSKKTRMKRRLTMSYVVFSDGTIAPVGSKFVEDTQREQGEREQK